MKMSKKTKYTVGCLWLAASFLLILLQIVFLTVKLTGSVDWNWWTTLIPLACLLGLPIAVIVVAVIVIAPKGLVEDRERRKRVEAEAEKLGIERQPGESIGDLNKRIVRRNMMSGNYSRKEIKDLILEAFPTVGSCQIFISNHTKEIVLIPRCASGEWPAARFTNNELREIANFAAEYIPIGYNVTACNAETKEGDNNGNAKTDDNA